MQVKKDNKGYDFGALQQEHKGELLEAFPRERRDKQLKWYFAWAIVNMSLCAYILALVIIFWDEKSWEEEPCVKRCDIWLIVYLCL